MPARDETPLHGLDHPLMSVFFLLESAFHFFLNVGMATREKDWAVEDESNYTKQSCYSLLIVRWTVQVVDKPFQLHKHCAIASSTLLHECSVSMKCRRGLSLASFPGHLPLRSLDCIRDL